MLERLAWGSSRIACPGLSIIVHPTAGVRATTGTRSRMMLPLRGIAVAAAGFGVVMVGLAFMALPVPGAAPVVILLGLAILAKEFPWARTLLDQIKKSLRALKGRVVHLFARTRRL